ncbi:MAG: hypothetical protein PHV68_06645 [Candidatus Gastranaerophilales bacterium]|nr:hypothetical protein [Candidatus Gastranaerophilales bacterium]
MLTSVVVAFSGVISENDLHSTVYSQKYIEDFSKIKIDNPIIPITFVNPDVNIKNNRLLLNARMNMQGFGKNLSIPFQLNTGLTAYNDKIKLADIRITTDTNSFNLKIPVEIFNAVNPVLFGLMTFEQKGTKIQIKDVAIKNDKINVGGIITIPKNG